MRKTISVGAGLLLALSISLTVSAEPPQSAKPQTENGQAYQRPRGFLERANPVAVARAITAQQRHTSALLELTDVHGTAVGWQEDGEPVVKIFTRRGGNARAGNGTIPATLDGVAVVVEAVGPFYALNVACDNRQDGACDGDTSYEATAGAIDPRQWQPRPVPIGVSVAHVDVTAGTLGCRVLIGCHSYALSNAHVFANENAGLPGDRILQPGPADGGIDPDDSIATLFASVPIVMASNAYNVVDAAIAAVSYNSVGNATPASGYGTPRIDTVAPVINMDVMKYGRTSGLTHGYIDAINASVIISYKGGNARFVGQIIIRPTVSANFSRPGDSGSLVVAEGGSDDRKPVGLIFASATGISVANPIDPVIDALGIIIDGD